MSAYASGVFRSAMARLRRFYSLRWPRLIEGYNIVGDDLGVVLVVIPDLKVDAATALFRVAGSDLYVEYPDGRVARLPNLPHGFPAKLRDARSILFVEETKTSVITAVCVKSGSLWSVMSPSNAGARV